MFIFPATIKMTQQPLTAKYTYFNQEGKKDVFIASGLINKDECSIRFNGYLTLAREF